MSIAIHPGVQKDSSNLILTADLATGTANSTTFLRGDRTWVTPATMGVVSGTGTINELAYWTSASALGALAVATYPSLTELSYVKGVTSALQTQINAKGNVSNVGTPASTQVGVFTGASTLAGYAGMTYVTGTGQLALSTTGSGAGILIGGDFQIYRSAADVGYTPDAFQIVGQQTGYTGLDFDFVVPFNSSTLTLALVAGAGNVNTGVHFYTVTYTTAVGETQASGSSSITTDTAANGRVTVTVPVSSDTRVTGRKIYRSTAGGGAFDMRLLTTIADNSTTTYVDNIADASLGAATTNAYFRYNSTNKAITANLVRGLIIDNNLVTLGTNAGAAISSGGRNTLIGSRAGQAITSGKDITVVGHNALVALTTGSNNTAVGAYASNAMATTADSNTHVGAYSGFRQTTGDSNALFGSNIANTGSNRAFSKNTCAGTSAGFTLTGDSNVFLGYQAGYYETGSARLFIDNILRASEADARTKALIYGVFAATTATQTLALNAVVTISNTLTVGSLTSGRVPFASTGGLLVDDADMTFATDTLTVTKVAVTGISTLTGITTLGAPVTLKGYTVATLPAGVQGHKAFVTDALAPSSLVAVVGGGAVVVEVLYNGTAWVATAGTVTAGVYTPTRSAEANMDASVTMSEAQYMRVGSVVTVSGRFTADPTLAATATSFEITLPIASNIGAAEDAAGVAFCGSVSGMGAAIIGVAANDTAKVAWVSSDVTSQLWSYTFTYAVI